MGILNDILNISWITFLPFLELRASIPYGLVATELHWSVVFLIGAGANILLGILLYLVIGKIAYFATKNPFLRGLYGRYVERTQRRIKPLVDKHGEWALAVFIGIPLPGTGSTCLSQENSSDRRRITFYGLIRIMGIKEIL